MKKQVFNPYLPSWEYIPDGEPRIFGDRLYVFGSHDRFGGTFYCENDYVAWSCPATDLSDWRYDGVIYRKTQHPGNEDGKTVMYAPDVQRGRDGRYYLYYGLRDDTRIAVAVSDLPSGKYEFLDFVRDKSGAIYGEREGDFMPFDPAVLVEESGIHLYAGQGARYIEKAVDEYNRHLHNTVYHAELEDDMITLRTEPTELLPNIMNSAGTGFEGHEFFEASSIRHYGDKYYFIYSSVQCHELVYAVSSRPDSGFKYAGVLTSNGDINTDRVLYLRPDCDAQPEIKDYIGNNHGSIAKIGERYYIFAHRHTNRTPYSRQAYADRVYMDENGFFSRAERTSCGLNDGPLNGIGKYEARIACVLMSKDGALCSSPKQDEAHPYFTQHGSDREDKPDQYIANMRDGSVAGFRYFRYDTEREYKLTVTVSGNSDGHLTVSDDENGNVLAEIAVHTNGNEADFSAKLTPKSAVSALYFRYHGTGAVDFIGFEVE